MNISNKALPGIILTLPELYRSNAPGLSSELYNSWKQVLENTFIGTHICICELVCSIDEYINAIRYLEKCECNVIIVLPLAYSPSGVAVKALAATNLPILLISSSRDNTLPYDLGGDDLLANQAMHGVQDISNGLWRKGIAHLVFAGHPQNKNFEEKLSRYINISYSAYKLKSARIGQLGGYFSQMLDFTFNKELQERILGYNIINIPVSKFLENVTEVTNDEITPYIYWLRKHFQISTEISHDEMHSAARYAIAYQKLIDQYQLDGMGMNFQEVIEKGANNLPFIGIDKSMYDGFGYAGEGDVQTAALMAALFEICPDISFVEMFCPDYGRNEILLSHMGESNFKLANTANPIKIKPRKFAWGNCIRLAVPVFQLKPGYATLVSLTEEPSENFRMISALVEVIDAPEHTKLENPHSRIIITSSLEAFLEDYSNAGGPHHLCLLYGDWRNEIKLLTKTLGINHVTVQTGVK